MHCTALSWSSKQLFFFKQYVLKSIGLTFLKVLDKDGTVWVVVAAVLRVWLIMKFLSLSQLAPAFLPPVVFSAPLQRRGRVSTVSPQLR